MKQAITSIDAHSHPQFLSYDGDRDAVMSRLLESGTGVVAVGTQVSTSKQAIVLSEQYPDFVWAAAGFHPGHLRSDWYHDTNEQKESAQEVFNKEELRTLVRHPKVVAIGECGFDYYVRKDAEPLSAEEKMKQKEVFVSHMELSSEEKKPLMIHCRSAFPDLLAALHENRALLQGSDSGVVHFFSGSKEEADELLEFGFSFTFGGVITFVRDYDNLIKRIPIERLLPETDAPYVTPVPHRGERNEPAYVSYVIDRLAELKNLSTELSKEKFLENASRIFRI
ncbi:MAG: TatD family hydrolase [Patescibacteria group bacterium]